MREEGGIVRVYGIKKEVNVTKKSKSLLWTQRGEVVQ
jgi:hypothetical protein